MTYRIEFTPKAERQFRALPVSVQRRLRKRIDRLAAHPRPRGVEKLEGGEGLLRIRVGSYRVIYVVEDDRLLVLVIRIGHRREVYRGL
jgi:mRNA interferase RelE/StbE